jgi:hypothetical protein
VNNTTQHPTKSEKEEEQKLRPFTSVREGKCDVQATFF